jgi:nucleotide-binding universal stress UspA family protein
MYTKILVPLDGSTLAERALTHAEMIAKGSGAELILMQVVGIPLASAPEVGPSEENKTFSEGLASARAYLEPIGERLRKAGLSVRSVVAQGVADSEILGFAHRENVDILVMSTHGRSGLSKLLMGSVAQKVMVTTKRPVMLVKPERVHVPRVEEVDTFMGVAREEKEETFMGAAREEKEGTFMGAVREEKEGTFMGAVREEKEDTFMGAH